MRVVFDSNVWIAALAASGTCKDVVEEALASCEVIVSPYILQEVDRALGSKIGAGPRDRRRALGWIQSVCREMEPPKIEGIRCTDPQDLPILWLALSARADLLITGDGALLRMKQVQGTRVISPASFWEARRD